MPSTASIRQSLISAPNQMRIEGDGPRKGSCEGSKPWVGGRAGEVGEASMLTTVHDRNTMALLEDDAPARCAFLSRQP